MFEYRLSSAAAEGGPLKPRAGRRISSVMPAAEDYARTFTRTGV